MKDIFEIIISGITEFLFWERTEEYIQSDKERKRKSFVLFSRLKEQPIFRLF